MIPGWLLAHLTETGRANADGISRGARVGLCRFKACGRRVLRGLDDDMGAFPVQTDLTELDAQGELIALSQDRKTFTLSMRGGKWLLDWRGRWQIASGRAVAVVAEHRCGLPLPPAVKSIYAERPVGVLIDPLELGKDGNG